jgi:hypothetical protein
VGARIEEREKTREVSLDREGGSLRRVPERPREDELKRK